MEIIIFIIAFVSTLLFTIFVRKALKFAEITDNPTISEHRHKAGTPTMGGLAILLGILLTTCFYFTNKNMIITTMMMMAGGLFGIMDDLIGLKPKEFQKVVKNIYSDSVYIGKLTLKVGEEARVATAKAKRDLKKLLAEGKVEIIGKVPVKKGAKERQKIFVHFVISLFLIATGAAGSTILGFNLGIFAIPVIIFGIIGSINVVNLIDGMDGLAPGILAIASAASAIFSILNGNINASLPFIAISGACFAFLIFNRYPATIIMGDTGSIALGAGYATAAILGNIILFSMVALTVPIISVMISLLYRLGIIKLAVEPLHHTLHYRGLSERKITFIYWMITLVVSIATIYLFKVLSL
ncbi:MAG: phospho-N-acetylmuramoyl-pentapeptide-transferase [Euryarchaeota archaeon]|nr:phospho-N-acetylmuramoyl-pentapeptide-transferase [Euryarchaeota archaeon]